MPIKPREFEATDPKTGMTIDELAEWIKLARADGAPGSDVAEVTTGGFRHLRIKTVKVRATTGK